jgi:hypothetical protein
VRALQARTGAVLYPKEAAYSVIKMKPGERLGILRFLALLSPDRRKYGGW